MSNELKSKKSDQRDRIPLSKENTEKIDRHIEQVKACRSGVKVSRKIYIDYLLRQLPNELATGEVKKLATTFFDQESFLRFLMTQVKESKRSGSGFDLDKYIVQEKRANRVKKLGQKTPKKTDKTASENPVFQSEKADSKPSHSATESESQFTGGSPLKK